MNCFCCIKLFICVHKYKVRLNYFFKNFNGRHENFNGRHKN